MRINGDFIEDLERLQEHYQSRFVHYSALYNFAGKQNAKKKCKSYKHCVIGMEWLLKLLNKYQDEYWALLKLEGR